MKTPFVPGVPARSRRDAKHPHAVIAAGTHGSIFKRLIAQNVDGLHAEALRPSWDSSKIGNHILELCGTLFVPWSRSLVTEY